MSRDFILPAIFAVMVIGMTIFPDRSELLGGDTASSDNIAALDSASQG